MWFIGDVHCRFLKYLSLVTEWVKGKTLDQALEIKNTNIAEELALPPVKRCSSRR